MTPLPCRVSLLQVLIVIYMLGWVYTSWAVIPGHCSRSESQSRAWDHTTICTQCASGAVEGPWPKTAIVEPASEGPGGTEEGI